MADYVDLPVHPLIKGLAVGLKYPTIPNLSAAKAAAFAAAQEQWNPPQLTDSQAISATKAENNAVADFADPQRAEVVTFAGYLGPEVLNPVDDKPWRFLYQDARAVSWLLVPQDAIILHDRTRDRKAAFRLRDVIWVRADAPVRQGTEEEEQQSRFLVGPFTIASDLHSTLTDTNPPPPGSGILCAPTPECCGPHTHTH
jgi:hypothetical protein